MGNLSLRGLQMLQFKKTYAEAQYFFSDIKIKPFGEGYPTPRETEAIHYNSKINRPGIYYDRLEMLAWVYTTDKKLFLIPVRKFKDLFKYRCYERLTSAEVKAFETLWKLLTPDQKERFHYDKQWKEGRRTLYRVLSRKDTILKGDKKIEVDVQKYEEAFVHRYETTFCTCLICTTLKEKMSVRRENAET